MSDYAKQVGDLTSKVIQWWQRRAREQVSPAIREIRVGYNIMGGPTISAHWVIECRVKRKLIAMDKEYYVNLDSLGTCKPSVVIRYFERELARGAE